MFGDYQVRKIRGVKRHIAMVFFAYVLLQLGSGFDRIMGNPEGQSKNDRLKVQARRGRR